MIRRATILDANDIFNIGDSIFDDFLPLSFIEEELKNENSFWFVAIEDNQTIGFIGARVYDNTDILDIAVKNEYRKKGIGSLLLEEILKIKCGFVTLEVRVHNINAIRLYEKHGFKTILKRPNYYSNGDDAYYMIKE